MSVPTVTVVIRTTGEAERVPLLLRSIPSALSQANVRVDLVLVVNGTAFDGNFFDRMAEDRRVAIVYLEARDGAKAIAVGRSHISGEFFSFLDDDDELLPHALRKRLAYLIGDATIDCVATNGYYFTQGSKRSVFPDVRALREDYVLALLSGRNWMASNGATFRTSTVGSEYFANVSKHCHWTLIAYRIALHKNVCFVPEMTFNVHDTPGSASKGANYVQGVTEMFAQMLRESPPARYLPYVKREYTRSLHCACSYARMNGEWETAWRYYRATLAHRAGWKYLPYAALLLAKYRRPARDLWPLKSIATS